MKHTIRFTWDNEEAVMIVDSSNARCLYREAALGNISILSDTTIITKVIDHVTDYVQSLRSSHALTRQI